MRDRWGRVARIVLIATVLGCLLAAVGVDDVVTHADPEDDLAALAFLAVVLTYAVGGLLTLVLLLTGLARRLEAPSIVGLGLLNLTVGGWWAWCARPSDPACIAACGNGGHAPMPAVAIVLLWAAALVHVGAAAVLVLGLVHGDRGRSADGGTVE